MSQKKSSRFTEEMNRVLIQCYKENQAILKSKFSTTVTNDRKKEVWKAISTAVNAVNIGERKTTEQVKKRWEDMATAVKKKERITRLAEIKRLHTTGNGSLPDDEESSILLKEKIEPATSGMSSPERQVADVLGVQAFLGISGGHDTLDTFLQRKPGNDKFNHKYEPCSSNQSIIVEDHAQPMTSYQPIIDSLVEVEESECELQSVQAGPRRRKRKSLADAQLEYFEVATKYYLLKTEKLKLEIEAFKSKKEE